MFASGLEKNVCYERNRFMEKADNEMYALVDEEFLAKFSMLAIAKESNESH